MSNQLFFNMGRNFNTCIYYNIVHFIIKLKLVVTYKYYIIVTTNGYSISIQTFIRLR